MFQYITFRSACAVILSLLIATVVGKRIIRILQKQQVGEEIRDLGLEGQMQKKGTPTMGGVIILLAILVPVILFARLDNVYIQLMIVSTIWLGLIGFLDIYEIIKTCMDAHKVIEAPTVEQILQCEQETYEMIESRW